MPRVFVGMGAAVRGAMRSFLFALSALGVFVMACSGPGKAVPFDGPVTTTPTASATGSAPRRPPANEEEAPFVASPSDWKTVASTCGLAFEDPNSVAPTPFSPCASGRVGCRAAVGLGPRGATRFQRLSSQPAYADAAGLHLSYVRPLDTSGKRVAITETLGVGVERAIAASADKCALTPQASVHGWGLAVAAIDDDDEDGLRFRSFVAWNVTGDAEPSVADFGLGSVGSYVSGLVVQRNTLVLDRSSSNGPRSPKIFGIPERAVLPFRTADGTSANLVGDSLYFSSAAGVFATRVTDAKTTRIATPQPNAEIAGYDIDTSRNELVWLDVGQNATGQLFKASLASSEGQPVAESVAILEGVQPGFVLARSGTIVVSKTDGSGALIDTMTGIVTPVPAEAGSPFARPLWLDEKSVWFFVSETPAGKPASPLPSGVIEISRADLAIPK